jgi:hypothetical protein
MNLHPYQKFKEAVDYSLREDSKRFFRENTRIRLAKMDTQEKEIFGFDASNDEKILEVSCKTRNDMLFMASIFLQSAKPYEIDEYQKSMLLQSRPLNLKREIFSDKHLPFPETFLDVQFEVETESGLTFINGILLKEAQIENKPHNIQAFMAFTDEKGFRIESMLLLDIYFDMTKKYTRNHLLNPHTAKTETMLKDFIFKFLCFLDDKDVKIRECVRGQSTNERRMKQGKMPLPDSKIVYLTGELCEYVEKAKRDPTFKGKLSYEFDVAGHNRHLKSDRYKTKKVIRIKSYRKGKGVYIPHKYILKKEEKDTLNYDDIKEAAQ